MNIVKIWKSYDHELSIIKLKKDITLNFYYYKLNKKIEITKIMFGKYVIREYEKYYVRNDEGKIMDKLTNNSIKREIEKIFKI